MGVGHLDATALADPTQTAPKNVIAVLFVVGSSKRLETIAQSQRKLAAPVADIARQSLQLEGYQEKLERVGQLPDAVEIESYFQHLSKLSDHHNLRVVRQEPLSRQTYPGLYEARYAYDVVGVFPDILAFLNPWICFGFPRASIRPCSQEAKVTNVQGNGTSLCTQEVL